MIVANDMKSSATECQYEENLEKMPQLGHDRFLSTSNQLSPNNAIIKIVTKLRVK
jgi:hypothetical protein